MNSEFKSHFKINTNNLNPFTKTAYKLMSSRRKYFNIFIVLTALTLSLSCFTELTLLLCKAFSRAVKLNIALANSIEFVSFEQVQFAWGIAWGEFVLATIFLFVFICCIILGVKILKIYFTFNKLGILIEPCAL